MGHDFADVRPLLAQARQIWGYTPENLEYLNRHELSARLMPLGYHARLRRCLPAAEQDIDILFMALYTGDAWLYLSA